MEQQPAGPAPGSLGAVGWDHAWEQRFEPHAQAGLQPGRVVRHDGSALVLAIDEGHRQLPLSPGLDPAPVVGDWVGHDGTTIRAVVDRTSLLRRANARGEGAQPVVANLDVVLVVCGADRPAKPGRVQRFAALASDAGARPVLVVTKADVTDDPGSIVAELSAGVPGIEAIVASSRTGQGLGQIAELARGATLVAVGESGSGKSSLVNALAGAEVAATGEVRPGDRKGRHTTTARQMHVLPGGGCLVDTPGVRAVGLWIDPDAIDEVFPDVEELAASCRFGDCRHDGEPGCAVAAAAAGGALEPARLAAWHRFRAEVDAVAETEELTRRRARGRRPRPG